MTVKLQTSAPYVDNFPQILGTVYKTATTQLGPFLVGDDWENLLIRFKGDGSAAQRISVAFGDTAADATSSLLIGFNRVVELDVGSALHNQANVLWCIPNLGPWVAITLTTGQPVLANGTAYNIRVQGTNRRMPRTPSVLAPGSSQPFPGGIVLYDSYDGPAAGATSTSTLPIYNGRAKLYLNCSGTHATARIISFPYDIYAASVGIPLYALAPIVALADTTTITSPIDVVLPARPCFIQITNLDAGAQAIHTLLIPVED